MIVGLGMDLVEIERFRTFQSRWGGRGLRRIFGAAELEYCLGRVDPAPSLAARFAAKEAFFKALGLGWGPGGDWVEVTLCRRPTGAPELAWSGRAERAVQALGAERALVSLTHSRAVAGAVVVLEA